MDTAEAGRCTSLAGISPPRGATQSTLNRALRFPCWENPPIPMSGRSSRAVFLSYASPYAGARRFEFGVLAPTGRVCGLDLDFRRLHAPRPSARRSSAKRLPVENNR